MDFTLSEEQALLRDSARALLGNECPPSLVRAHVDDPAASDVLFDRHLREWVALGDGPLVDLALFCQEAGRVLLPGPHLATTTLFLPLLRAGALDGVLVVPCRPDQEGRPEALAEVRRAALDGDNTFAALMEAVRHCSLGEISTALFEVGGRYRRNV